MKKDLKIIHSMVQRCSIAFLLAGINICCLFFNDMSVLAASEQPNLSYGGSMLSASIASENILLKASCVKKPLQYQYVSNLVTSKILLDRQYYPESLDFSLPADWSLAWAQKPSYKSTWGIPQKPGYPSSIASYDTVDKFVKAGQSVDNWDELITVQITNPRFMAPIPRGSNAYQPPANALSAAVDFTFQLSSIEKRIKKNNPQAKIESLYIRKNPNDTLMSVNYIEGDQFQQELIRFIRNQGNRFMIRYASKAPFLQDEHKKEQWINWIDSQIFQTSVKKFNFWNVYAEDVVRNTIN